MRVSKSDHLLMWRMISPTPKPALHLAVEARHDSGTLNEFALAGKLLGIFFEANDTIEWELLDPSKMQSKCD